jgi:hypothetical protein
MQRGKRRNTEQYISSRFFFSNKNEAENLELKANNTESLIICLFTKQYDQWIKVRRNQSTHIGKLKSIKHIIKLELDM